MFEITPDLSNLTLLRAITTVKDVPLHLIGLSDPLVGIAVGKYYYVNAMSEILKFDMTSMQWSSLRPPHRVSSFQVGGDPSVEFAME